MLFFGILEIWVLFEVVVDESIDFLIGYVVVLDWFF